VPLEEDRDIRIPDLRTLWALVREDLRTNGKVTWPGFQALAVHRFGVWKQGIRSRILRLPFSLLYRLGHGFVRNVYGIELFISTRVGRRVLIAHQHGIIIHANAVIGDDCVIRQGVSIGQTRPTPGQPPPPAPRLGRGVEVGVGAVITGDIVIGDGAVIGPNAVVMTNVPPNSIVTAPPSRVMPRPFARKPAVTTEARGDPAEAGEMRGEAAATPEKRGEAAATPEKRGKAAATPEKRGEAAAAGAPEPRRETGT
jgi:serine O-acetyltransferase